MFEPIEEIQSKDGRKKGIEAWAEMLEILRSRGPREVTPPSEGEGGGASLPRDQVSVANPRTQEIRQQQVQQMKAATQTARAEAQRTQDSATLSKPAGATSKSEAPPATTAAPPKVSAPRAPQTNPRTAKAPTAEAADVAVAVAEPKAEVSAADRLAENSATAVEEVLQLANQSGLDEDLKTSETVLPEDPMSALEEAIRLAELRSGHGANPELAAKDYVLASELPGVSDTPGGAIYEDFRVAL